MREIQKAASEVHALLSERSLTLALAESCTGGMIANLLTDIPGASMFFVAGVITYSVKAKMIFLDLPESIIKEYGVVSSEAALRMADGARVRAGTDIGLATTGNLGPDRLEDKPAGLVYVAVSFRGEHRFRELRLRGSRMENKESASSEALRLLKEAIESMG